jgi:hypothetical protein
MAKKSRVRRRKSMKRKSRVRRGRKIIKGGADEPFFANISDKSWLSINFKNVVNTSTDVQLYTPMFPVKIEIEAGIMKYISRDSDGNIKYDEVGKEDKSWGPKISDGSYDITHITNKIGQTNPSNKPFYFVYYQEGL